MKTRMATLLLTIGLAAPWAIAQDQALPGLDELLGLETDGTARTDRTDIDQALDPSRAELDRKLTAEEAHEKFAEAVAQMGDAARRLSDAEDAGVRTQRLEESILRKLDQVIAAAEQQENQQSSSSSSSSSSQQQQQQQQQSQQNRPQQQQQQGQPDQDHTGPGLQEGDLGPQPAAGSAAWGRLPARTRDALVEGLSDRYSALYERMTEAYYRRLAEDRP